MDKVPQSCTQLFFVSFFTLAPDFRRLARKKRNEK
ncbi:pheST operon leader peptide PheM [Serratia sp. FDAARGOS_506]|nr:pheST operon leader peptide PheM [Serratia sp. FDAARGOS_506]